MCPVFVRQAHVVPQWLILLSRALSAKCFFVVCFVTFVTSFIILTSLYNDNYEQYDDYSLVQEALNNAALDPRYAEVYRKRDRLPNNTKYLLLWTPTDFAPFYFLGKGQKAFIDRNCSMINCYVTDDKYFFRDVTRFDAIGFNGRNILDFKKRDLPRKRSPRQKYIYFNMESADNYPVCNSIFDNFFNWTSTYRLDSDIPYTYIKIKDKHGRVVGPKRNMEWKRDMKVDEGFSQELRNKSEAAAWFVSHCASRSGRKEFVRMLQTELRVYGFKVDIYGSCGPLTCPIEDKNKCNRLLEDKYFFYMSLENSFDEDYVTEKLLTALLHNAVPVVFGGANYSRFLPPNSYLDGRAMSPKRLAATMARLAWSPELYRSYFSWRSEYSYHDPALADNVCALCEALNDRHRMDLTTTYRHFRKWWNPQYGERCRTNKFPLVKRTLF